MMVKAFRQVGWIAGVAAAALGCYMLSLNVAAERAELARVQAQIIAAKQGIRSLETELGTRGRLAQLEQWNAEVLALSAPAADQFVESEVTLARFDRSIASDPARVQLASADEADAAGARPMPAVVRDVPPPQPKLVQASLDTSRATAPKVRHAAFIDSKLMTDIGAAAEAEGSGGQ